MLAISLVSLASLVPASLTATVLHSGDDVGPVDFNRDVRPILSDRCFACHGPDSDHREADLRLDLKEGVLAEGAYGGHIVVPGNPAESELVYRILEAGPGEEMPPADFGKPLSDHEKAVLLRWVEQGAPWQEHWSFVAPQQPALPAVQGGDWVRNPVDAFLLARLEAEGLGPSPEADRRTLIRRLSFDLTGLPPTPFEVESFVDDPSPDAYERVVDRLLASPRYGETMARFWLDAARYGDTHGLHLDNYREIWPYRDWVIRAFNDNLRFDRFTVEQIAGDLLPDATLDQQIASAFNRLHVSTNEGGSIKEEVYVRNVVDRVSTTGTVFLGLTLGCAVCHEHKFDPIEQTEFYQLFAFFNNLDGDAMDGNVKDHAPVVKVPTAEQTARLAELDAELASIEAEVQTVLDQVVYEDPGTAAPATDQTRETYVWIDDALPPGAIVEGAGLFWVEAGEGPVHSGRRSMRRTSNGNQQHFFPNADQKLRIAAGDRLFAWVHLDPESPPREIMLQWNSDGADGGWKHRAFWGENLIPYGQDGTTQRRHLGDLPPAGEWVKLEVPVEVVGLRPGMVVHGMAFTQFDGTSWWDTAGIESSVAQEPVDFDWIDDDAPSGAVLAGEPKFWQWVGAPEHPVLNGLRSLRRSGGDRLNQDFFTGAQPLTLQAGDRLYAHAWLDPEDPPRSVQLQFNNGTWEHRARWGEPAHGAGRENGADHCADGSVPVTGRWVRLEVGLEEVGLKPGDRLNGWAFTQVGGTVYWDRAGVHTWGPPDDRHLESQQAWERLAAADDSVPEAVRTAAAIDASARTAEQQKALRDHYLRHVFSGTRQNFDSLEAQVTRVRDQQKELDAEVATCLVMKERTEPRDAFLLHRGQYDAKGEQVEPITPAALPAMDPEWPRNRLGFARWLVDPRNPLTARVTVNRLWQQVFGTGLVKTAEDFGNQGERPSHPALLDWLATEFVADGWDVKRMMRRLVTSAAYRQSSRVTPELLGRDQDNRLLARGPRFRLDAEALRDQALAVSGLLVHQLGGPPVKPPQPDGLWFAVGYTSSNTARFVQDTGPDKVYRRTLYTFWKRTAPPPQLSTFDAPSREACTVRRERTNTPLQALLLLNDPQFVEAARHLAGRVLREAGEDPEMRAAYAFYVCAGRPPDPPDLDELVALYRDQRTTFEADPEAARALISVGESEPDGTLDPVELASWTVVANLVLNLDEVVTKR